MKKRKLKLKIREKGAGEFHLWKEEDNVICFRPYEKYLYHCLYSRKVYIYMTERNISPLTFLVLTGYEAEKIYEEGIVIPRGGEKILK